MRPFDILSVLFCIVISCSPTKDRSNLSDLEASEKQAVDSIEEDGVETMEEEHSQDDEIREFGRIINIEDSGYPMHIVTIEFVERNMTHDFSFNAEAGIMGIQELSTLQDKFVTFSYTSDLEFNLYDIQHKGMTLLGEYAPDSVEGLKQVTGVLAGAEKATGGDLPDKIMISPPSGEALMFEFFVTDEIVAENGQKVTVFYDLHSVDIIRSISKSEE